MEKTLWAAIEGRRTYYGIGKDEIVGEARIREIVENAVKHTPSSFNSQSARAVILMGAEHDALWDITKGELQKIVPPENFAATAERIQGFANGYGTILFFEDDSVIRGLQEKFALYKDNFPLWSLQSSGMLQFVIWTALEAEGLGASLQHYNPLIDAAVKERWSIPADWKLLAQMPFGKPTAAPGDKEFQPLAERVKFFK